MSSYVRICLMQLFVWCIVAATAVWQGLGSFMFAWVLNLMLMMGVLHINQTLKPGFKSTYYDSKKWEVDGKVYERFGVHGFRKLMVWIGWEKLNKPSNPVRKNLDALKHLEHATRQSEAGHMAIFFIVLMFALFVAFYDGVGHSKWLFLLNIILNAYPIAVQRYNRPRLRNAISRWPISRSTVLPTDEPVNNALY